MCTRNTIIVSDLHLTEAKTLGNSHPLWMVYKKEKFFIDSDFASFLEHIDSNIAGEIELVLNGDTFDFDIVLTTPNGDPRVDCLAKWRGLGSEEWMSLFKMNVIIEDHPIWFKALKDFIAKGHRVVFVIGNHDIELYWPSVQERLLNALESNTECVRFCNWFYISEGDTYISHGHQYDPNCVARDTINPTINGRNGPMMRIPFGDHVARYVINGIGWLNPHSKEDCILTAKDYFKLFFRHFKSQPLMVWSWFWGSVVAFCLSLWDHWRSPIRSPLTIEDKVNKIAKSSNATPSMVYKLEALKVASACSNPITIFRELWLDRGLLLLGILFFAWQIMLHINIATHISMGWFFVPFVILLPMLLVYASNIKSTAFSKPLLTPERAEYIVKITGVERIVLSHTHNAKHQTVGPVEYLNTGSWAPVFGDIECTTNINQNTFIWIKPTTNGRQADLYIWPPERN